MIDLQGRADLIEDMQKESFPFPSEEVLRDDYYLTLPNDNGLVKPWHKITLKDGRKFGKIIPIPFCELKKLVLEVDSEI